LWPLRESQQCQVLRGHKSGLAALRYRHDGRLLATGGFDFSVKLWDTATGKVQRTLTQATEVDCLALSPDGSRLATGGRDSLVRLWDVATGRQVASLQGHTRPVHAVEFSPDGECLACVDNEGLKVWKVADASLCYQRPQPDTPRGFNFRDVAFSPDGRYVLAGGGSVDHPEGTISIWEAATGRAVRTWHLHEAQVKRLVFSPNRRQLATVGFDRKVILWDWSPATAHTQAVLTLQGHKDWIADVAFSPDGRRLATASFDHTTKLWDARTGKELLTLSGHTDLVSGVTFSPNGETLATSGYDGTARLWNASPLPSGWAGPWLLDEGPGWPGDVAFSPDGRFLAAARENGKVQLWDTKTGWPAATLSGHPAVVESLRFSADGRTLATLSRSQGGSSEVKLWDPADWNPRRTLRTRERLVQVLAFLPDGNGLAALGTDCIVILDETTGDVLRTLRPDPGHLARDERFTVGAVSPDGGLFAAGGSDHALVLWDTASDRSRILPSDPSAQTGLVFSPDGKRLFSCSMYWGACTWDPATGKLLGRPTCRPPLLSLSLTTDGRTLALGDHRGAVQRWDTVAGRPLGSLQGYAWEDADRICFSPDGLMLAVAAKQGGLKLWTRSTP
jgi:WD40 repeat protein